MAAAAVNVEGSYRIFERIISFMEIRIGIQNVAREVVLESEQDNAVINEVVSKALDAGGQLRLTDSKGREVIVPVAGIAYVEIGPDQVRRVGFAQ